MIELFDYQKTLVDDFDDALSKGFRRPLVVCPTGGGKTVFAGEIIKLRTAEFKRTVFVAHRDELLTQARAKLKAFGIDAGIIKAGRDKDMRPQALVQVCGIQTLYARAIRGDRMELPPADYLWIDECHRARAMTYMKLIEAYPAAVIVGLTATPCRGDGRGLGNIFDVMLQAPQVGELIEQGYLCKLRIFAPPPPDLRGVGISQGDYVINQLSDRMNTDVLVGDFVLHWLRHAERRRTVVYAVDIKHSVHLAEEMRKSEIKAEHLDGTTPQTEREAILERLRSGEIEVVANCMVLTEGFDLPALGCIGICRPTRSLGLFRQMVGRGLRRDDGKIDVVILDHSGGVHRHGRPDDAIEWTLDTDQRATNPTHEARLREFPDNPWVECKECREQRMRGEACPNCGYLPGPPGRAVDVIDADLIELGTTARAELDRKGFYLELRGHQLGARKRDGSLYAAGWAAQQFKSKFGHFPPWAWNNEAPVEPSVETRRWIRSRQIAWLRARAAG
jgi:superfamily II DNA or RNA helicase